MLAISNFVEKKWDFLTKKYDIRNLCISNFCFLSTFLVLCTPKTFTIKNSGPVDESMNKSWFNTQDMQYLLMKSPHLSLLSRLAGVEIINNSKTNQILCL